MIFGCRRALTKQGWVDYPLIQIDDNRITSIQAGVGQSAQQYYTHTLVPGMVDVQVNGGGGVLFNQQPTAAALRSMYQAHLRFGTTSMLPTLITDDFEHMQLAANAIKQARSEGMQGIVGVHFEGPWLSTARKGVHSEQFIRPPTDAELQLLDDPLLGVVKVTLAPETVPVEQIKALVDMGVKVFLGHSNATAEQVLAALEAGACGFTHLFNAMSPMASRAPGMVGVALNSDAYCGLIVDGYHVDPICAQVAIKAKGVEQMLLVTDAMALAATDLSKVSFFDTTIERHGDKLTTPDGTLAGSCLTMIDAVQNTMQSCNATLADCMTMASYSPAKMLGLSDRIGAIAPGYIADLLLLDEQQQIQQIWQQGQVINLSAEE